VLLQYHLASGNGAAQAGKETVKCRHLWGINELLIERLSIELVPRELDHCWRQKWAIPKYAIAGAANVHIPVAVSRKETQAIAECCRAVAV